MKHELYDDVMMLEDGEGSAMERGQAMQRMINSGQWSLQGSYGRAMMEAIEVGAAMLGPNPAKDYWGNRIPSRSEVEPGSKGSREFVVEHFGEEWAAAMEDA